MRELIVPSSKPPMENWQTMLRAAITLMHFFHSFDRKVNANKI